MNKKETVKIIPTLRFPEFAKDRKWEEKTLDHLIGSFIVPMRDKPKDLKGEIPWCRIEDFDGIYLAKSKTNQGVTRSTVKTMNLKVFPIGTLLVSCSADLGRCAITAAELVTNQTFIGLVPKVKQVSTLFLYYLLINSKNRLNALSSGTTISYLSRENFEKFPVCVPEIKEQHKIADCLSSLDKVISSHTEKLKVLKAHKKGLMQNLFPQEGQKLPKQRFREFINDGGWEEKTLGQCLIRHPDYGINAAAVPYSEKLPTYLRITDISGNGHFLQDSMVSVEKEVTDENYLEDGDIVLARTGASVGKSYKYRVKDGRLVFAGFLIRIRPDKKKLNSEFLFQFLGSEQYWRWVTYISARSGQPGINGNEYSSMILLLPSSIKEQKKIADCFSSLDALITAQADKIEQLKNHKKGLMQGLFPPVKA